MRFEQGIASVEKKLDGVVRKVAQKEATVARYTAWDIQKAAKRSIKSGGKKPSAKNYKVSKPGEAPKSHVGTLKQAIRVAKVDEQSFIVGPEQRGGGKALSALEYGGTSTIKETYHDEKYVANVQKAKRRAARAKKNDAVKVHPKAKRPYTLRTRDNPRGITVSDYVRFYSTESWEHARKSAAFQNWAKSVRTDEQETVVIAPRPYMFPALRAETTEEKIAGRFVRAFKR